MPHSLFLYFVSRPDGILASARTFAACFEFKVLKLNSSGDILGFTTTLLTLNINMKLKYQPMASPLKEVRNRIKVSTKHTADHQKR